METLQQQLAQVPSGGITFAIGLGVGMFIGWMIGVIRGHKKGLRERAARFYR